MHANYNQNEVLRYCRQTVLKAMNGVRAAMRGSNRLSLKKGVRAERAEKCELNPTKGIDVYAEDLILEALTNKLQKIEGIKAFTVFSEELGIRTFPEGVAEEQADLVIFIDPIDGTEFIETLQGGWCLVAVYDRKANQMVCAVAGDIFLNRLYWASAAGWPRPSTSRRIPGSGCTAGKVRKNSLLGRA